MIKLIEENGKDKLYRLSNAKGAYADIMTYGGRLHRLCVLDKNGTLQNVVAGFDDLDGYKGDNPYFNATIGRVSNRIKNARFTLNGKEYRLFPNEAPNHLHGGKEGLDRKYFNSKIVGDVLELTYLSKDGEENYPGNLEIKVEYSFSDDNELSIKFTALSDADTPVSLTNHAYFNLSGNFDQNVLDTVLWMNSTKITEFGEGLAITGKILDVTDTPYDFKKPNSIGSRIFQDYLPLKDVGGYDNNYVLDGVGECATAYCPKSGINLTVSTDYPCLQFYTGNFLDGLKGRNVYYRHSAFCLEPQMYPDAVNVPTFPTSVLKKGEIYDKYIKFKFDVK